jgi:hypothetical protein
MDTLATVKILPRIVPALVGMLIGMFFFVESTASVPAVPIININPSTDVPNPYGGFDEEHGDGMVGWTFQLLVPFTVTQVGWYDQDTTNGLSRAFEVGLWKGQGSDTDPGTPHTIVSGSLIGNPTKGLFIPAGTNASLLGVWRVVDVVPFTLQPGFYELGGLDTSGTTDVIKYVRGGNPGLSDLPPPGSPLVVGEFFYAQWPSHTNFGPAPPSDYYLYWGLELGPMLFGTNAPFSSGLSIRVFPFSPPRSAGILLTWPTGTLEEADEVTGPYTAATNAASPHIVPSMSARKFYRLSP